MLNFNVGSTQINRVMHTAMMAANRQVQLGHLPPLPGEIWQHIAKFVTVEPSIALGYHHTLVLTNNGQVYTCGMNHCPLSQYSRDSIATLCLIELPEKCIKIAASCMHTLILTLSGKVYAFGDNSHGQLGLGSTSTGSSAGINNFRSILSDKGERIANIATGSMHTIMLTSQGQAYACGKNHFGQLGLGLEGDTRTRLTLTALELPAGIGRILASALGETHTVILTENGEVYGCGSNSFNQLGLGYIIEKEWQLKAINLPDGENRIKAIAAEMNHTLMVTTDGRVYVCGNNSNGQLGLDEERQTEPRPYAMKLPRNDDGSCIRIKAVATGINHSVMLTENGQVYTCGSNEYGQLGLGLGFGGEHRVKPQKVPLPTGVTKINAIAAAGYCTMLLTAEGYVYAFGDNFSGQLSLGFHGISSLTSQPLEPMKIITSEQRVPEQPVPEPSGLSCSMS